MTTTLNIKEISFKRGRRVTSPWSPLIEDVDGSKFAHEFFSDGAAEFFDSKLVGAPVVTPALAGDRTFFITSEKYGDVPRTYSVRVFDGERVETIGEHLTAADAAGALYLIAGVSA